MQIHPEFLGSSSEITHTFLVHSQIPESVKLVSFVYSPRHSQDHDADCAQSKLESGPIKSSIYVKFICKGMAQAFSLPLSWVRKQGLTIAQIQLPEGTIP